MIVNKWDYIISDILDLCKEFILESKYPITYSSENGLKWLYNIHMNDDIDIIVNYDNDILTGFSIVCTEQEAYNEQFGYIIKFYVKKEYRGTTVARQIMQETVDWFDNRNVVVSFATATANINQDNLFRNLLKKFKFTENGSNLIRIKENVKI